MSDTTVTPIELEVDAVSADVITNAEGGTSVTTGNTAVIAAKGVTRRLLLTLYSAAGGTAIVAAGDNPPSLKAGLGNSATQTLPAGDVVLLVIDPGRYSQDDGKVRVNITGTVIVGAFLLPREM